MTSIGNYRAKKPAATPAPSEAASGPQTPPKTLVDAVETGLQRDVDEATKVADKALTYEQRLAKEGLSLEEAHGIRDALLVDGHYSEFINLSPNTSIRLRTRSYHDLVRMSAAVERANPRYLTEADSIRWRYCLAASLESYREHTFTFPNPRTDMAAAEAAFEERHKFVLGLPEPVIEVIGRRLAKFDAKVSLALSEGAVEDF